jgi:hypothetical protein
MSPRRRQQMHKVAATKKTQPAPLRRESQVLTVLPTPDPTLEGTDPAQKQRIGALTMLAEVSLLIRNSQRPKPQRESNLFDDDNFLRDFFSITDREQSVVRKTVPPLLIRTSPARPKLNKFTNITREIVDNREIVATIEKDKQEKRPEMNFFAVTYVEKEKTPYYSKIINNIWEFQLFG